MWYPGSVLSFLFLAQVASSSLFLSTRRWRTGFPHRRPFQPGSCLQTVLLVLHRLSSHDLVIRPRNSLDRCEHTFCLCHVAVNRVLPIDRFQALVVAPADIMESYMARRIHHSRYAYFDVDITDCPPSPPFSHHTEHTSWDSYPLFTLQDSGPLRKTRSLSPEGRHDTTRADDQRLFSGCSKPAHILERSLTPPCRFDNSPMDGSISPEQIGRAHV